MKIVHVLTRGDVLGGAQSHVRELSLGAAQRQTLCDDLAEALRSYADAGPVFTCVWPQSANEAVQKRVAADLWTRPIGAQHGRIIK